MKLTVKSLFSGVAIFWVVLAALVLYSCHPAPAHADDTYNKQVYCVTAGDRYGTQTTQCMDGTVTVSHGEQTVVCAKNSNGDLTCQKI